MAKQRSPLFYIRIIFELVINILNLVFRSVAILAKTPCVGKSDYPSVLPAVLSLTQSLFELPRGMGCLVPPKCLNTNEGMQPRISLK